MANGATLLTFKEERFSEVIGEAMPLLKRHWGEIARNRDSIPLRPDYVRYAALEERGQLLICTARSDNRLVGYVVYFVFPHGHIHYVGMPWAESDIYWVDPELRRDGIASELFQLAERELKKRGVVGIHTRAKNDHPAAGALLKHLGHTPIETVYAKVIE